MLFTSSFGKILLLFSSDRYFTFLICGKESFFSESSSGKFRNVKFAEGL